MVIIDQFRISDNGSKIYLDVHVNGADYFQHVYLDSITLCTSDKVLESTFSSEPTSGYIYKKTLSGSQKEFHTVIDKGVLDAAFNKMSDASADTSYSSSNFSNDLFFVYIKVKGEPDECTPCELDKEVTIGVTFDYSMFYQLVMGYTRELADDCSIPQGFTDMILLWNAFKAAVDTEHFVPAIQFWQKIFGNGSNGVTTYRTRGCGCHK